MITLKRVAISAMLLAITLPAAASDQPLGPRAMVTKTPTALLTLPEVGTGEITVKFADQVRARVSGAGNLVSMTGTDISAALGIMTRYELTARAAHNVAPAALAALEQRALEMSGRLQPDLAGTIKFAGSPAQLLGAAREFNDLTLTEYVKIDRAPAVFHPGRGLVVPQKNGAGLDVFTPVPRRDLIAQDRDELRARRAASLSSYERGFGFGSGSGYERELGGGEQILGTGACCIAGNCTDGLTPIECAESGGIYLGDGVTCGAVGDGCSVGACCISEDCQPDTLKYSCENQLGGTFAGGGTTCDTEEVCELEDCGDPAAGDCYDLAGNGSPFCDVQRCCTTVCEQFDPFCCDDEIGAWDEYCAAMANLSCLIEDGADRCTSPFGGSCYRIHEPAGCNNAACCATVAFFDPTCQTGAQWDGFCASLAFVVCGAAETPGTTPDYSDLQGYAKVLPYSAAELTTLDGFYPEDAGGDPLLGYAGGGWEMAGADFDDDGEPDDPLSGLYGLAQDLLDNFGVDATGMGTLTKGRTMRVAVIGFAYWSDHEELEAVSIERDQTLITIQDITGPDFGTADLGIIAADDDGEGITGLVPEADVTFFPLVSVEEGPRDSSAWASALLSLEPGDTIAAQYQWEGAPFNLNCDPETWQFIRIASDSGITVVLPAGDDCVNLDNQPDLGDSGGVVVGASTPGAPYYRLALSNYATDPDPTRGNVSHFRAWGDVVVSCGFGDFYLGTPDSGASGLSRAYTAAHGGTAAASAQVAGLMVALQGLAKQFYGIALMPETLRTGAMHAPGLPPPPIRFFGGFQEGVGCSLDLDPDAGPNYIGLYPQARADGAEVIREVTAGFDDAPLVDDLIIVHGDLIYGSKYSLKGSDGNYLVIHGEYADRGTGGSGSLVGQGGQFGTGSFGEGSVSTDFSSQLAQLRYPAPGDITDMVVVGQADIGAVQSMNITLETKFPGVFTLVFVEGYDWLSNDWTFIGVSTMVPPDPGADFLFDYSAFNAKRLIRNEDDRILIRVWTLGLTSDGIFGQPEYRALHDLVNITVSSEFGEGLP